MNIKLDCAKAFTKVKGHFKLRIASKKVVVLIPNGTHIDRNGRSMSLSELADILVHGTATIPARPFTQDAPKQLRKDVLAVLKDNTSVRIKNAKDINSLGEIFVDFADGRVTEQVTVLVKQWLMDGTYYQATAPNAPKTIQNKGSNVPLVDTGALVNSITAEVTI